MKYTLDRKRTLLLVVFLIFLTLLISRGWLRNSVLAWYGNQTVGKQVNAVFDDSFGATNKQFQRAGINPVQAPLAEGPICGALNYHYFHVTVSCLRIQGAYSGTDHKPSIPQALINDWPMILRSLNINGSSHSWVVDKSATNIANPSDMFKFSSMGRDEVAFTRQVNKVQCELDIWADPAQAGYPSEYHVDETCSKDINFFGGWDCRKEYCRP